MSALPERTDPSPTENQEDINGNLDQVRNKAYRDILLLEIRIKIFFAGYISNIKSLNKDSATLKVTQKVIETQNIKSEIETLLEERAKLLSELDSNSQDKLKQNFDITSIEEYFTETAQLLHDLEITESNIEAQLDELSDGNYISPHRMNEIFKGLPGVKVEIPEDEIASLEVFFPTELRPETIEKIKILKRSTEGEQGPLIMQLPQKILVNGTIRNFTIQTLDEIMQRVHQANPSYIPLKLGASITKETKEKMWSPELRVWTSDCLIGSKLKTYEDQYTHRRAILGKNYHVNADMIIALTLHYLATRNPLLKENFMNLDAPNKNGHPLMVCSDDTFLFIGPSLPTDKSELLGIGASFRIPS